MSRICSMTAGSPVRLLISFSLPLMLGNVFQQLYTVVDTMVVGKGVGLDALAAIGSGDWTYWMMLGIIQGLTQGFGILMAQHFGAGREEDLRRAVGASVTLSAVSSAVLVALGLLLVRPILVLLQTPEDILPKAVLYLQIMFLGVPVVMAYNLLACILRALGDGKTPLNAMIVACFVNIGLDLLFVMVFRWGIVGAACASVIAQGSSAVYCLMQLGKIELLRLKRSHFCPAIALSGRLLVLGLPMAVQNILIAIGGMIIQSVVNGYGVLFIAGFTASNKLYGVLEIAASSYGYAMSTYVGQNLGAGKLDRIKRGMRAGVIIAVLTSLVIAVVMLAFGRSILSMFISGSPENVKKTMDIAYAYLSVMSICLPVLYLLHVYRSALQGMGDTMRPMVSGVAEFVMRTGGVMVLPAFLGAAGIYLAEVLAWLGADLILIPSWLYQFSKIRHRETDCVS